MRAKVFVSYSRKDDRWLNRCVKAYGTGVYAKAFEIWSDEAIETSSNWKQTIETAIASSRIALLLVSKNFLLSDFIARYELTSMLGHSADGDLKIWWIPIDPLSDDELSLAALNNIQAPWPPDKPLSTLSGKERDRAIAKIFGKIIRELGLPIDVDPSVLATLEKAVGEGIGTNKLEAIAPGDYSIIYKAKKKGTEVAVKALIPSPRRQWLGEDFIHRARIVQNINNSTAIKIADVIDNRDVQCIVMEMVTAPTLKRLLEKGPLPTTLVARVLKHLARLATQLHALEGQMVIGPVRPSQVYYDDTQKRVRISLVHIANETIKSCRERPTLLLDDDALTYLSPERYEGQTVDAAVDQYYLGLLALELLQGKPPVDVATFASLETKKRFFESPRAFFGDIASKEPAFSFVLARMLERKPAKRWSRMADLIAVLQQLESGEIPEVVREHADADYNKTLRKNDRFFQSFYNRLFETSREISELFAGITMEDQYQKLDRAMSAILAFNRKLKATTLDSQVESHRKFGLKSEHFGLFRDAFLHALRQTQSGDEDSQDAWRAILSPALAYMQEQTSKDGIEATRGKEYLRAATSP
jgi:serine/threonine protein kinase